MTTRITTPALALMITGAFTFAFAAPPAPDSGAQTVPGVELTSPQIEHHHGLQQRPEKEEKQVQDHPLVELAICLDTSGSMNGLIDAARQKLWSIVNDLALAKPTPKLRVALLTYGNDGHSAEDGWVQIDSPFTEDLDSISQKLFALTTNGGTELVARVLHDAQAKLDWQGSDDNLKLIVVAGNESADQDHQMHYQQICKEVIRKGIMIDSIYCGNPSDEIAPGWREVAQLADGQFASIDQNNGTVVVATPFDSQLAQLSSDLNTTYIAYGVHGKLAQANQIAQDVNAANMNSAAAAARCQSKGSALYSNTSWDLVDACNQKDFNIEDVKKEDLPENMQKMTVNERKAYVKEMQDKRTQIQQEVQKVSAQRLAYIADEMKKQNLNDKNSFDRVIRDALRAQAEAKGFTFTEPQIVAKPAQEDGH